MKAGSVGNVERPVGAGVPAKIEPHRQGMNLAYRNGAVRFLSAHPREDHERELFRSLGRESETEPDLHDDDE